MVEVILPVLDEAEALPWVLGRVPPGFVPIVVDNGSRDGSAAIARRLGAQVVDEPRRGFGAACFAGLWAAGAETVCFMDCDGSLDPGELPALTAPVLAGVADLALGARRAEPRAWPLHARVANRLLALELRRRTGVALRDLGPMRAAGREPLLALGIRDRGFGWPLEMVLRAAEAGLADRGDRGGLPGPLRTLQGHGHAARLSTRGSRHGGGPAMSRVAVVVIAKEPLPGRVKTRLSPPCSPAEAAVLAEAALRDTLATVAAVPARRRLVALEGRPGPWLPRGFETTPQLGAGLGERLANALGEAGGPALVIGMDTPQLTPGMLADACDRLAAPGVDAVLGPALDGGYWTIGLARPAAAVFRGVPMSSPYTGVAQRLRLDELRLRVAELPPLRDVDTIEDARAVARECPGGAFARALA